MRTLMRSLPVCAGLALGIVAGFTLSKPSPVIADEVIGSPTDAGGETDMLPFPIGNCVRCAAYLEPEDLYGYGYVCMPTMVGYV